jgi:predicted PurR-regulated permease PerM
LTLFRVIGDLAIIVASSFLMLLERDRIRDWAVRFLPEKRRVGFVDESEKSLQKVGRYVLGQLIVMSVIGIGTGLGMFILGIPFALPIGLLGFLGEIVPYIGPIVAGVPAAILGFIQSPLDGLIMTAWLIALQALEGYVLSPLIQHKVLRVSPLAVILVVVAALSLFGIIGALVAVPFVAIADVLLEDVVFPLRRRKSIR